MQPFTFRVAALVLATTALAIGGAPAHAGGGENGTSLQGTSFNGSFQNGQFVNGLGLNGGGVNGRSTQGAGAHGVESTAPGIGTGLDLVEVTLADGRTLRIER